MARAGVRCRRCKASAGQVVRLVIPPDRFDRCHGAGAAALSPLSHRVWPVEDGVPRPSGQARSAPGTDPSGPPPRYPAVRRGPARARRPSAPQRARRTPPPATSRARHRLPEIGRSRWSTCADDRQCLARGARRPAHPAGRASRRRRRQPPRSSAGIGQPGPNESRRPRFDRSTTPRAPADMPTTALALPRPSGLVDRATVRRGHRGSGARRASRGRSRAVGGGLGGLGPSGACAAPCGPTS